MTIFSILKQNKQKIFFRSKNPDNLRGFCPPNRKCNSWQGFYCSFMWQYLDILGEKAKKFCFTRLWTGKIQVFQAPTGYSTADKAFIAVLCDNVWEFWAKKPKKKKNFRRLWERKNTSISSPNRIFNSWQGFYCSFIWQYLDILREKAKKNYFRRLWRRKNTSISSPNRIFNSWRGFYCIFKWQYFGILRGKSQKKYFRRLWRGKPRWVG